MSQRQVNPPTQVAWSVKNWCAATDLSPAYTYELIAAKVVKSAKVGGKRLITTSPRDFLASLAEDAA
jgi:hypothetical protein